jgi:hypothetical protein
MEAPEVRILIQQSWQLFGTFTFRDDVMSTARRFNMFFAWLRQSAKQFRVYFPDLPWCLRMEDGEMSNRRHFHFLIAGFPARLHLSDDVLLDGAQVGRVGRWNGSYPKV